MNADQHEFVINCDGCSPLYDLALTDCTEDDAVRQLVLPVAESKLTAIDLNIGTTGRHICRTRHGLEYALEERSVQGRRMIERHVQRAGIEGAESAQIIGARVKQVEGQVRVIRHYNRQPLDLLDIVIKHGHALGLKVYAGVRLNHANSPDYMRDVPGPDHYNGMRKDFRSQAFQDYLLGIYADLLQRGLDGLTLDFERKAPFFPKGTPQAERFEATRRFLYSVRGLNPGFVTARVSYQEAKGVPQGQDPVAWMHEGLLDAIIPATHNHEPDTLDWGIERFVAAAHRSPRTCRVWPQIWPTAEAWTHPGFPDDYPARWHPPEAIEARVRDLLAEGADGAYFFNFFPWPEHGEVVQRSVEALRRLPGAHGGAPA